MPNLYDVSYSVFKAILDANPHFPVYDTKGALNRASRKLWCGNKDNMYCSQVDDENPVDVDFVTRIFLESDDDAKAYINGIQRLIETPVNALGVPKVQTDPVRGARVNIYTHNFANPCTWYTNSVRHSDVTMLPNPQYMVFTLPTGATKLVDVENGHQVFEEPLRVQYEDHIKINGSTQVLGSDGITLEPKKHSPAGLTDPNTNYVVDYTTGTVTFRNPQPNAVVTISYSEVTDSIFVIKPKVGKKLTLKYTELNMSLDSSMRDTLSFDMLADVGRCPYVRAAWDGYKLSQSLPNTTTVTWNGTGILHIPNVEGVTLDDDGVDRPIAVGDNIKMDADNQWFEIVNIFPTTDKLEVKLVDFFGATLTTPSGNSQSSITTARAPLLPTQLGYGPLPFGFKYTLKKTTYQTMQDIVGESRLAHPLIKKTTNPNPSYRDLTSDCQIFEWDYGDGVVDLYSSYGMEIRMYFENHIPIDGTFANTTVYAISEDEDF